MMIKKYLAELLGTFGLSLVVMLSIASQFSPLVPFLAAVTLGLFVYSIGHVSGAHVNPAVTIGAWSIGKIKPMDALGYIVAQFAGAALAVLLLTALKVTLPPMMVTNAWQLGVAEAIGVFFFTFGIASVVYGQVSSMASGLVIGGSLLIGIVIAAALGSNGVLNPAVAFAINSFGVMYIVGPIVGAVAGMWAYRGLAAR